MLTACGLSGSIQSSKLLLAGTPSSCKAELIGFGFQNII
jgi:hypothetical protein